MNQHALNPVRRHLLQMFALDVEMVSGSGAVLRDAEGREYLDFLSQYGALPFGHNPPAIWNALLSAQREQVPAMIQPLRSPDAERLAARLAEVTPGDLGMTTFTNSGAETVEAAIKLARMRTGRQTILSADNSFHGKTLGALSATGKPVYQQGFGAPAGNFAYLPYGDLSALRAALEAGQSDVAGFIVEPIQGKGGVVCPPDGYIDGVIALCREYGVLSILDEIQTGLGRSGELFACNAGTEVPDMLLLSKALGGGLVPIGACVVRPSAWDDRFGRLHSSTFAANALACRAGLATIDALLADESAVMRNVAETGQTRRGSLREERIQPRDLLVSRPEKAAHHHPRKFGSLNHAGCGASSRLLGPDPRVTRTRNSLHSNLGQLCAQLFHHGPARKRKKLLVDCGRGGGIRTLDLRYPKPSRYQAALRPDRDALQGIDWFEKPSRRSFDIGGQKGPALDHAIGDGAG